MKKAVVYGAGNIGRGFIGRLFYESGYSIAFIDINKELVRMLNQAREYPVRFAEGGEIIIKNVRAIDGENHDEAAGALAEADIMAVSVGADILKYIMEPVASGINKRFSNNNLQPLNIILCENLIGADKIMRDGVREYINFKNLYDDKIGFIESSVGAMAPNQTDEMRAGNPLRIVCENYSALPVNKDGFKGEAPEITGMTAHAPFDFFIRRKLFIHNLGHAACAYLGSICGHDYIWQAVREPYIELIITKIMQRSALALAKIYHADMLELNAYLENLIYRFGNKALGDTVNRVGGGLKRKLSPGDRIAGAYKICLETGVPAHYICLAVAAAVNFNGDKLSGAILDNMLKEAGSLDLFAGNFTLVKRYDELIKSGAGIRELFDAVKNDENKA